MQNLLALLQPVEFSDMHIGRRSFLKHDQFAKENLQGQGHRANMQLAEKALAATVLLEMIDMNGQPRGFGSGFFVRHDQIATNFHVVEGTARGTAKLVNQPTRHTIEGITACDVENNLAILKVADFSIRPLSIGDSDTIQSGETVYVSGNPKESEGTFSDGSISGRREVDTQKWLQMTTPISPGSGGGPVLNEKGEVIGISFMTIEDGQNLNFAIPSNYLKTLLARLEPAKPLSQEKQLISAATYFYIGNEKYLMGLYQEAIGAYDEAIRMQPDFAYAYINKGLAKEKLGQHETAIMDYSSAIKIDRTLAEAYNNRGSAQRRLEQHFLALEDLNVAIQLDPHYVKAYINRGNAKSSLGHPSAALEDFDIALDLDPSSAEAYNNRGIAKASLMQLLEAIKNFDTAIQLNPELANAYYSRGIAKSIIGRQMQEAKSDLQTALKLAKKTSDVNLKSNVELALSNFAENTYRVGERAKGNSLKLFITYAHKDIEARDKLIMYLAVMKREGLINIWHDNEILPGDTWRDSISSSLAEVDLLLYLVSANSLASENCNKELAEALNANVRVIPIILDHCDWIDHQLSDFQVLPDSGKPISVWENEDEGWQSTVSGIRKAIHQIRSQVVSSSDISQEKVLTELYFGRGNVMMMLGEIEGAIKAYSDVIELNPRYSVAYNNRGVVYANNGEYKLAIKDFDTVLKLNSNDFFAYNNRGNVYSDMGKVDKAITDFNAAIELKPDYAYAYNNRGNAYGKERNFERAIKDFNRAIKLEPDFAGAYNSRGAVYYEKGDSEKAIEDFNTAIKFNPNYVSPYINRGRAHGRKGTVTEAISDFSKVIELDPNYADAYYDRGVAYGKKRKFDQAIADYTKAIELNPDYVNAYCNRGSAYLPKGEFDLAITDYTKAIELDPDSAEVYWNRALVWLVLRNWDKAKVDLAFAEDIGLNISTWFHNLYKSVADFERIIDFKLPEDVVEMLTPKQISSEL